jgi:hypothetical protein
MTAEEELRKLLKENPDLRYELSNFEQKAIDLLGLEG